MKYALLLLVAVAFLTVEVALAARVWAQATSQPTDTEAMVDLFELTDDLAGPFEPLTGKPPLHTTGVIDYTVLVAMEAYFIATLVIVFAIFMFSSVWAVITGRRTYALPSFVRRLEAPRTRRRAWQPVHAQSRGGARVYRAFGLQDETPAHSKAGLGPV